ncbi:DUF6232 family protein [Micromonospora sp. 4G57]|jgi:hypothetical protein|uniref:DUF6232 family protein n=1 Tax=Micromonospora sicca TaxID=2202420 RepID=A0ABU5JGN9_9ACTN|nr:MULTISPECIES: DUF6232 family protein [unclassified Micromonospora]MDZ5442413.1 DUF6232 family protein [Micromonospora sp. 4G57]MDZ5491797.1 DUF6232 family protein [Micromonospora sp. 4G53]
MTLYYRDDAVQVTSESIHAGGHVIALADVAYVWHARGATTLAVRGRVLGRGVLVVLLSLPPLVALVCVVSLAWAAQDRGNWKLALVILAAFVVGGLVLTPFLELPLGWLDRSYERGNRVHELWVQHHGREVMLLRTPDALRFGQIYRAVQRAVEQQGDRR